MTNSTLTRETTSTATTDPATRLRGVVLAATRIVVGLLFLCHGLQAFGLFGGVDGAGTAVPVGSWPGFYAGVIEVLTGALVAFGLFTRSAAVLASGTMAYAYFTVHQPLALLPLQNMGEQAALFSWIFLLIAALGPGALALDNRRRSR
ncbi:DoxX family protein [Prauserella cavernicola]|uniref:DoxX family protein n=1 Tax=Prauserella cavernicola TaxID=2800127 RepID=A0A934QQL2_9PSEU|nr:DoxX family protein [Prauserella cavernicola]MBK1784278.1 DoxX family protein [Prauserella cavernicola]